MISRPVACKDLIAVSLPAPGPDKKTSVCCIPWSIACFAAFSAAVCAANGVPFLAPLKPVTPADAHDNVSPFKSVIVIIVLLNVALIWAN